MFPFDVEKSDGWKFGHSFMYEIVVRKDSIHIVGVLSNFERENSQLFIDYAKGKKASKWKRVMTKKVLLKEEDISDGLNEDTIEKLNLSLKDAMIKQIPKFENDLKNFKNQNDY